MIVGIMLYEWKTLFLFYYFLHTPSKQDEMGKANHISLDRSREETFPR
jgi:hypothetical protein